MRIRCMIIAGIGQRIRVRIRVRAKSFELMVLKCKRCGRSAPFNVSVAFVVHGVDIFHPFCVPFHKLFGFAFDAHEGESVAP